MPPVYLACVDSLDGVYIRSFGRCGNAPGRAPPRSRRGPVFGAQPRKEPLGRLVARVLGDEAAFERGFEDGLAGRRRTQISFVRLASISARA